MSKTQFTENDLFAFLQLVISFERRCSDRKALDRVLQPWDRGSQRRTSQYTVDFSLWVVAQEKTGEHGFFF